MYKKTRILFPLFFFFTIVFPGILIGAGENSDTVIPCRTQETKTLTRLEDYIVVHGLKLRKSLRRKIGSLSLFALHGGELKPIPFQIDEINRDGEWVLPQIPPHLEDKSLEPEADDDNGHFDENDELVFMVRDSGDRARWETLPEGAVAVDEIELIDPVDRGKSWAYLVSFLKTAPPRSQYDYVDYTWPLGRVISDNYELGFSPDNDNGPNFMRLLLGKEDIIDRMKIRFSMKFLKWDFSLDETNFQSKMSFYKDGQIRVVRRIRNAIKFTRFIRTPSAAIENVYYDNICIIPVRIAVPFSPKKLEKVTSSIKVRGGADFHNLHGWKMRTETDPRWFEIDGIMDEAERSINGRDARWFILNGPRGALLFRMVLNRNPDGSPQDLPISTELFYVDDDNACDPPEEIPGQSPNVGFLMEGVTDLPRGVFYFYAVMYMIKDYREGMERDYFKILDHPVEVSVK